MAVIHADCRHALRQIAPSSVDFVLTDSPYVSHYTDRSGRTICNDNWNWLFPAFKQLYRVLKRDSFCVCFYGWTHADKFINAFRNAGFYFAGHFAFPKRYISGKRYLAYQHEAAYPLTKGRPDLPSWAIADVVEWTEYPKNELHPSQKPLSILKPLIEAFCRPGGTVLDPFAGSGSTLMAARELGRRYLGIELDAEYHAIASRRLGRESTATAQIHLRHFENHSNTTLSKLEFTGAI
jgi:adenine-specific DNA-methyltransferase